jgi:hypothetical protein
MMEPQAIRQADRKRSKRSGATPASERVEPPTDAALDHEEVARRAYALYVQRGSADGHAWDDWLCAERELNEERRGRRSP